MKPSLSRADVVALAMVAVLLFSICVPTLLAQGVGRQRELANRGTCAANLRGLVQSMAVYANDWDDNYPALPPLSATTYDASLKPLGFKGDNPDAAIASEYKDKTNWNNPAASLWILVLNGSVASKQFLCKSDPFANTPAIVQGKDSPVNEAPAGGHPGGTPGATATYLNFQDSKNLSYSMDFPWTGPENHPQISGIWKNNTDASQPMLSDMAPYLGSKAKKGEPATMPADADPAEPVDVAWAVNKAYSQNHQFDGQNVCYGDNHVDFDRVPTVGQNNDSIWGIRKAEKAGQQAGATLEIPIEAGTLPHPPEDTQGQTDTVMVPTRDASGNLK